MLLPVAYARGGIPRFRDAGVDDFLERVDTLRGWAKGRDLVQVGVAAHSVRAVQRAWLERIGEYARRNGMPLHVHADEQPREIEECRDEHGMRPVELLAETGFLGRHTTVVHATHADEQELGLLAERGSSVCACPTTEGNLGEMLGLSKDWVVRIVKLVGNYGEVFERNVGSGSKLGINRGLNNLWTKGGIQYAPPVR